jgi:quercetin dioxygenase-like cupin family protein
MELTPIPDVPFVPKEHADGEVAEDILSAPEHAKIIHGSGGTRWYTGDDAPDYLDIADGDEITVMNVIDLAMATPHQANTVDVHGSEARGVPLFTNGTLGADLLYVPAGKAFPYHVHPGHHLLYCVAGAGTITYAGKVNKVRPGDLYMIEASVPHGVGADPDGPGHWLISFGSPHTRVDSHDRMEEVDEP